MWTIPLPSVRQALLIAAVALLVGFLGVKGCEWQREEAEKAKQAERDAQAAVETAVETIVTIEAATERDRSIDEIVAAAKTEIDNAPNPDAAAAAARAAICQLSDYRDSASCKLP